MNNKRNYNKKITKEIIINSPVSLYFNFPVKIAYNFGLLTFDFLFLVIFPCFLVVLTIFHKYSVQLIGKFLQSDLILGKRQIPSKIEWKSNNENKRERKHSAINNKMEFWFSINHWIWVDRACKIYGIICLQSRGNLLEISCFPFSAVSHLTRVINY